MSLRQVVVTGVGAISPLGVGSSQVYIHAQDTDRAGAKSSWKRLIAGNCGIVSLDQGALVPKNGRIEGLAKSSSTADAFKHLNCRVAGLIPRHLSSDEHWDLEVSNSQDVGIIPYGKLR
jgi:hypothetical protein